MQQKLASSYKTQILISIVVAVIIIALKVARGPWEIATMAVGALLGTFFLDLEYIIYAYFFEPDAEFSINLKAYIKHKDMPGTLKYIQHHSDDVKDKSLNSALFQLILIPILIYISYATTAYFVKALALSVFANSIYRMAETHLQGNNDWFWALKSKPDKRGVMAYTLCMLVVLIFCFFVF